MFLILNPIAIKPTHIQNALFKSYYIRITAPTPISRGYRLRELQQSGWTYHRQQRQQHAWVTALVRLPYHKELLSTGLLRKHLPEFDGQALRRLILVPEPQLPDGRDLQAGPQR